ncbi:MAG: GNAT family N-acetyltransferase [Defluviitaleaceae bacterium]|nr:GNAT family N-acetyltransferase [Defluviitaleaceae bacterium]
MEIICIKDKPHLLEAAAGYFAVRWGIDEKLYIDSMKDSLTTSTFFPHWFVMMDGDKIIGGYGIIENDFMVESDCDFSPWFCALYIDKEYRGQSLGAKLLEHSTKQAAKLGLERIYLNTDHIDYYEQYGWIYEGDFLHQNGEYCRVYSHIAVV